MFGLPAVIRSDQGAAFASELMASVRSLLGIKTWDKSAAGDVQHHALLENQHKVLDSTLDMAMNKGDHDLNSEHDLQFYTAASMAQNNLDMLTDTSTAFERVTGEIPRTMMEIATYQPCAIPKLTMKVPDTRFVNKLKDYNSQ